MADFFSLQFRNILFLSSSCSHSLVCCCFSTTKDAFKIALFVILSTETFEYKVEQKQHLCMNVVNGKDFQCDFHNNWMDFFSDRFLVYATLTIFTLLESQLFRLMICVHNDRSCQRHISVFLLFHFTFSYCTQFSSCLDVMNYNRK